MKIILLFSALMLLFLPGCEEFREALEDGAVSHDDPNSETYRPRFVVGIFSIVEYPRASDLEKELPLPNGRSVWINTNQNFSSKNLRDVRVIPRPGNPDIYDLQFRLDRMGKTQWMMLNGEARGEEVVMMVDDRYVGSFMPESLNDGSKDWVTVRIGVDAYTAKGIVKFAQRNYEYYNPEAGSWFKYL